MKRWLVIIKGALVVLTAFLVPGCGAMTVRAASSSQDIYDVILFFGQSNMVGEALKSDLLYSTDPVSLAEVSVRTGVDIDILMNTSDCETTIIPQEEDSVYQYSLTDDAVFPIETGLPTGVFGRTPAAVTWDLVSAQWVETSWAQFAPAAFGYGTCVNMVPEFCRTYHQLTGHKVIAVSCAIGGAPIQAYLPMDDPGYSGPNPGMQTNYAYMYKGVVDSVTGAVALAQRNGWAIGGAYFVSFQGEADICNTSYGRYYQQVVRQWEQLGFTKGALVETSAPIGDPQWAGSVRAMHERQEKLIADLPELVLGSSFDYDHYVPDPAHYDDYWKNRWQGASYEEAYTTAHYLTDSVDANRIHLNSAALSQIGRETAENLAAAILQ